VKSTPSAASLAWLCAQEYERLGEYLQDSVLHNDQNPLFERRTALNAFGMIDHNRITVDGRLSALAFIALLISILVQPFYDSCSILCLRFSHRGSQSSSTRG
jgi:hypothetical protein